MRLIFVGSGSAFTVGANNYQSNMLLESGQKRLLIDCGTDIRLSLYELGYTYRDIRHVFVSHLHADHIGGLEWLAFTSKFNSGCQKPCLHINHQLVEDLWNRS